MTLMVRNSNNSDLTVFFGAGVPISFRGVTVTEDDTPIAITGIYSWGGKRIIFSDIRAAGRKYKREIIRFARQYLNSIQGELFALEDENEPTSAGFLEHFGFVKVKDGIYRRE